MPRTIKSESEAFQLMRRMAKQMIEVGNRNDNVALATAGEQILQFYPGETVYDINLWAYGHPWRRRRYFQQRAKRKLEALEAYKKRGGGKESIPVLT
jgi:hypothetical protein